VLTVSGKTAKIYDEDGQLVCSFKNKEEVVVDEEYTVNNSYARKLYHTHSFNRQSRCNRRFQYWSHLHKKINHIANQKETHTSSCQQEL